MILRDAKSMMIDFGRHVGQCVLCTSSSFVKSDEHHVLWLQERVDSGEIRTEEWKRKCNTADNETKVVSAEVLRKHLKVLKRGDAKDVISWCYAQWCDGLSNARDRGCLWRALASFAGHVQLLSRASSGATSMNSRAIRVSENAKRN